MGCDACSWLRPFVPMTVFSPNLSQLVPEPIFFSSFSSSFRLTTAISCSSAVTTNSSSSSSAGSYSRRLNNPIRRQQPPSSYYTPPDILRHWIEVQQPQASQDRFTVASYNLLGDRNASKHKDLYLNVPSDYLRWGYRKRILSEELMGWNPDIICMQCNCFRRWTSTLIQGTPWRRQDMLVLISGAQEIMLMDVLLSGNLTSFNCWREKASNLRDLAFVIMLLNFQFLRQMCRVESRRLVVGNIHVLYNPSRGDVKLGQIRFLSSRAQILSNRWGNAPVVLGGDFNSTPQSAIYKFLSTSELNIKLYNRRELSGQRSCHPSQVLGVDKESRSSVTVMDRFLNDCWTDEEVKVASGTADSHLVMHPLKLSSSYATVKGSTNTRDFNGEPLATSYHSKFLGTVDYLWYSEGILPTRVLDTLPIDILRRTGGLPCKKIGSDHLALVSEFAFSKSTEDDNLAMSAVLARAISAYREDVSLPT